YVQSSIRLCYDCVRAVLISAWFTLFPFKLFFRSWLVRAGFFFFSSRRRHTRSVSAFLLNRSSDLYPKKKGIKDECSRLLEASTMKSRRGFAIQRLMNAMRQAHADGWFIVFDTLTLADDRLEAFYDNPNALRDYFRDIG